MTKKHSPAGYATAYIPSLGGWWLVARLVVVVGWVVGCGENYVGLAGVCPVGVAGSDNARTGPVWSSF